MIQHLSIRVPWHDNGWNGTVCKHPELNQSCRALKTIAEDKNDKAEYDCVGQAFCVKNGYLPPCLREGVTFMSERAFDTLPIKHPYTYDSRYNHIAPTNYCINSYSFTAKPYAWTLHENAKNMVDNKLRYTRYNDSIEVKVGSRNWVSNGTNQKRIFDYFYQNIKADKSMAIAYAKAIPFVESAGRVIIGIGMVASIENPREYSYNRPLNETDMRSYLWECQIGHSIRTARENGFVFPFDEIQKYLNDNPEQSPEELVVIAPDGYFSEFSYASEHLSHDALILTLNKTITVLQKYKQIDLACGKGKDWDYCIRWCQERLKTIWKERGLFPGLGNVLRAAGLGFGHDIALAMRSKFRDDELWDRIPDMLTNIKDYLPQNVSEEDLRNIGKGTFNAQYKINKDFLKLLSRINLTYDQAKLCLIPDSGKPHYADFLSSIKKLDMIIEIRDNPYLLYEQTRLLEDKYRFGIGQIDVALFPDPVVEGEKIIEDADDARRLRAIAVSVLENAAQYGNTLLTADEIVKQINVFRSDVNFELEISNLTVKAYEDFFEPEFIRVNAILSDDKPIASYQLKRLEKVDKSIRAFVNSRLDAKIEISDDWENYLTSVLPKSDDSEHEKASRKEKLNAIKIMAESKISVLTGGAGTGKTSTLVALCLSPEIKQNGIFILAPTGKARVVLETKLRDKNVPHTANTVFSFLQKTNQCDAITYRYYLSGKRNDSVAGATVIIDECSMLTEEMFGALAEAITLAKRVIFVGDPNQLPPIGTGKSFYDLVEYISESHARYIAKLSVSNRQRVGADSRLDVEFAKMFTYDQMKEVGEDIFARIALDKQNIEFRQLDNDNSALLEIVKEVAEMKSIDDVSSFDISLGGSINGEWMNFSQSDIQRVDSWQLLSPYKNDPISGSATLNRTLHQKYRVDNYPSVPKKRGTKNPLGKDGVLFGEKVINL
jgi:hypothetical protein